MTDINQNMWTWKLPSKTMES